MEQIIDILESTRELLTDEKSWTQGAFARDKDGAELNVMDEDAVQWCLTGAIDKVSHPKIAKNEAYYDAKLAAMAVLNKRWYDVIYYDMVEEMKKNYENVRFMYNELIQWNDDSDVDHCWIIDAIDVSINIIKDLQEDDE